MTSSCGPCGPFPTGPCQGAITIVQGYQKAYYASLFYSPSGAPYDLTGATQIVVSHPGASGAAVNEFYAAQLVLATTGNTTNTSNLLTGLASVAGLAEGQSISGTGIPGGTKIVSISGSTVTMSAAATATNTGVSLTFNTATNVTISGAPGAGQIMVNVPAYDSALMQINPSTQQNQDLQISVTNADGSITAFVLSAVLNVVTPPYGVV